MQRNIFLRYISCIVLFIVPLLLITCSRNNSQQNFKEIPLPQIDTSPIPLKVAYVINPRFNQMTDKQVHILLAETKMVVKEHFDVDIVFNPIQKITIDELFQFIPKKLKHNQQKMIYDFKHEKDDKERLIKAKIKGLKYDKSSSLQEMIDFTRPYLLYKIKEKDHKGLANALVETMIVRIKKWQKLKAKDGMPIIDESLYNEWAMWDIIGYGELPYDIVLTNQLVASIEYYAQALRSALRGGISAGYTSYNKSSVYGTYIFWSTFLYSNKYDDLIKLRGGETYTEKEAARLAGAYLSHEIGHLLFHFGHPYGTEDCVMQPVELLTFRQ